MSFMIYIEVKHWPVWYNFLVIPLSIVVLWVLGYLYEILGIRKAVDEETAKFVINKIKKSDDQAVIVIANYQFFYFLYLVIFGVKDESNSFNGYL